MATLAVRQSKIRKLKAKVMASLRKRSFLYSVLQQYKNDSIVLKKSNIFIQWY